MLSSKRHIFIALGKIFGMTLLSVLIVLPIFMLIIASFQSFDSINSGGEYIEWTTENYAMLFDTFWSSLLFTLLIVLTRVVLSMFVVVPAAYASSQLNFPYKKLIISSIIVLVAIPDGLLIAGQYQVVVSAGLTETTFGIILAIALPSLFNLATYFILKTGFDKIDKNLFKMSLVDGDSNILYFINSLSYVKKELKFAIFITSVGAWNSYMWPRLLLMGSDYQTLTMWIYDIAIDEYGILHTEIQAAASVIASIPLFVGFALFNKQIMEGIRKI